MNIEPLPPLALFSDDLRSSPPRIVELRRRYDEAKRALDRFEFAEDEHGEPIPSEIRRNFQRAERQLCAEEARVALLSENDQALPEGGANQH